MEQQFQKGSQCTLTNKKCKEIINCYLCGEYSRIMEVI